jgi:HSP20 family molecular chaperone IbpA
MYELLKLFDDLWPSTTTTYARKDLKPIPFHTELALPGVKKSEIKISIENGNLKIEVDSPRRKGNKIISLGDVYDTDGTVVKYEDGLLLLDVPLKISEKKEIKQIEIKGP